jgi:hypothetical protein
MNTSLLASVRRLAALGVALLAPAVALKAAAIDDCVNAMKYNHEGTPDRLPSSSGWATKGRVSYSGTAASNINQIIFWGTVYEYSGGNPSGNTRVQVRNNNLYTRWGSTWYRQQLFNRVAGGNYYEDWRNDSSISPGDRKNASSSESDGSTLRAGVKSTAGGAYNYHWFASSIKSIGTGNNGVCSWADFRLVLDNTSGTDDRASAKYLVNVAADYYSSGTWKGDVAIGRFLYGQTGWRRAYMHNLSESDIRNNPPPFN